MPATEETRVRLAEIPNLTVSTNAPLSRYTRFGIGGPADLYAETGNVEAFIAALAAARSSGIPTVVIGGGTNLVVSDGGFRGIVLRYRGDRLMAVDGHVTAEAGAVLQDLVDFAIERGLQGLETLAGIPGSVGAAVYGNAGAYGHSLSERVMNARFHDGREIRVFTNQACQFQYRDSIFKRHKDWIIFSTELLLEPADAARLRQTAADILKVRNEKFPVTMK
jgi:UDP-N-acetylmuramate dehydrogenase